ncbi:MAG: toll/interleukin-1 receptor domain-containing protein [Gemmatimonadales bacterium]
MPSIFISYAREDQEAAQSLADDLTALGQQPWLDQALTGGQAWWNAILGAIRTSDVMAFAISARSLESVACKRELGYAVSLRKPILPVLVADGVVIELLPPALAEMQFVDYRSADRDALRALARAVANLPSGGPLPEPLPPEPGTPISYLGSIAEEVESTDALTFEDQSSIVLRLKGSLRGPEAGPARTLLAKLRTRGDLYARIAEEIDSLLGRSAPGMRAAQPAPASSATSPSPPPPPPPPPQAAASQASRPSASPSAPGPGPAAEPISALELPARPRESADVRRAGGRGDDGTHRPAPASRKPGIVIVLLSLGCGILAALAPDAPDVGSRLLTLAPGSALAALLFGVYWLRSPGRWPLFRLLAILLVAFGALVAAVGAAEVLGFIGHSVGVAAAVAGAGVLAWRGERVNAGLALVVAFGIAMLGPLAQRLDSLWPLWAELRIPFAIAWVVAAHRLVWRATGGSSRAAP